MARRSPDHAATGDLLGNPGGQLDLQVDSSIPFGDPGDEPRGRRCTDRSKLQDHEHILQVRRRRGLAEDRCRPRKLPPLQPPDARTSMLMVETELRPSPIHGIGVFLLQPVRQGELIWRFDSRIDRVYTEEELETFPDHMRRFLRIYSTWH